MITDAQKQFDNDYKIIRHLFITCDRINPVNGGAPAIKKWIKERGALALLEAQKELQSEKFTKQFSKQSSEEQDEMKWLGEDKDE